MAVVEHGAGCGALAVPGPAGLLPLRLPRPPDQVVLPGQGGDLGQPGKSVRAEPTEDRVCPSRGQR